MSKADSYFMRPRALFGAWLLGALLCLSGASADSIPSIQFHFGFDETYLNEEQTGRLRDFLREYHKAGSYILAQGYACDRGGFQTSFDYARLRARNLGRRLREAGVNEDSYRIAQGIVLFGEPREKHRRVEVRIYPSLPELRGALFAANSLAQLLNDPANHERQAGLLREAELAREAREGPGVDVDAAAAERRWWLIILILIILFVIVILVILRRSRAGRLAEHTLTKEESQALALMTGGAVTPLPPREQNPSPADQDAQSASVTEVTEKTENTGDKKRELSAKSASSAAARSDSSRRDFRSVSPANILKRSLSSMASKKKKKTTAKITPISIRGALDKSHDEKTLSQLARSPVNALDGLTPRHARLLEEAFGVKTIEDLARLKYFEIAKAITILAQYEQ